MTVAVNSEWPTAAQAAANAESIRKESAVELARLEAKFGFSSEDLAVRLANAEIQQTAEICHWLLVVEVLASVDRGQST